MLGVIESECIFSKCLSLIRFLSDILLNCFVIGIIDIFNNNKFSLQEILIKLIEYQIKKLINLKKIKTCLIMIIYNHIV
jgi:hypothetical protein